MKKRLLISAGVAVILTFGVLEAHATQITFSAGTFPNTDWDLTTITLKNGVTCTSPPTLPDCAGNGGTTSGTPMTSGGNPGDYRDVAISVDALMGSTDSVVLGFHRYLPGQWDPGTQGQIASIDYSEDGILFAPNVLQATGPALRQNGVVYVRTGLVVTTTNWTPYAAPGLTAPDFSAVGDCGALCTNATFIDSSKHPDFSCAGGPIDVGFFRYNATRAGAYNTDAGIDNWKVTIHGADHLECYEIDDKDLKNFSAVIDLDSPQFGSNRCRINEAIRLCAPAQKTVVSVSAGKKPPTPGTPVPGQSLCTDFLCYELSEPKPGGLCTKTIPDKDVTDQFATRTVKFKKSLEICTPAAKLCGSTYPQCGGFCPDPKDVCQPTPADGAAGCHCAPRCEDVFWNICEAGSSGTCDSANPAFLGQSSFNLSCHDPGMNSADDCGQPEGDNTGSTTCVLATGTNLGILMTTATGCVNLWAFQGMTGPIGSPAAANLDCSSPPPVYSCTTPITSLSMQWTGPVPVRITGVAGSTPFDTDISPGQAVTVSGYHCP
jgi:hypothetical protein